MYYDKIADGYDELHREEQREKYQVLARIVPAEAKVLDIGHGSGMICEVLENEIVGLDPSEKLLERSPAKTIRASFDDPLPFEDQRFDWVVCVTALHHAKDPGFVVSEAERVAKHGTAFSILRALDSYERLAPLFADWHREAAGADTLFWRTKRI